jgi:hypothetical protein
VTRIEKKRKESAVKFEKWSAYKRNTIGQGYRRKNERKRMSLFIPKISDTLILFSAFFPYFYR